MSLRSRLQPDNPLIRPNERQRSLEFVYLLFITLTLIASQGVKAAGATSSDPCPAIDLSDFAGDTDPTTSLCLYIEESGTTQLEDVLHSNIEWVRNQKETVNFGYDPSTFWVRLRLKGLSHLTLTT